MASPLSPAVAGHPVRAIPDIVCVATSGKGRKTCYVRQPMTTTFAILLGGALSVDDRVRALVDGARVIAADSGIRHATALGLTPELWMGDFDSAVQSDHEAWPDVERQVHPAEKNYTDGELAIEAALERGAKKLIFVGALEGERTDHAGLHMIKAIALAERGLDIVLTSGEEEAVPVLPGRFTIDLPKGSLFSILPFSDLEGVVIENARYPLDGLDMVFGSSRTLSNIAEGPVTVGLNSGRGLLIARPHDFSGS